MDDDNDFIYIEHSNTPATTPLPIMGSLKVSTQRLIKGNISWKERVTGYQTHRYHNKVKKIFKKCRFCLDPHYK